MAKEVNALAAAAAAAKGGPRAAPAAVKTADDVSFLVASPFMVAEELDYGGLYDRVFIECTRRTTMCNIHCGIAPLICCRKTCTLQ